MAIFARSIRKNFLMGVRTVKPTEIQAFSTREKAKNKNLSDIYVGASESFEKQRESAEIVLAPATAQERFRRFAGNEEKDADEL